MDDDHWTPRRDLPVDLVRPSRLDPSGLTGPTRGQSQRGRWRASSRGLYVPADVGDTCVEQRILEQAMRVREQGAVTGWASLRWQGAAYFDGTAVALPGSLLPVPLARRNGHRALDDGRGAVQRGALPEAERRFHRGVWCTPPPRALVDEVRRRRQLRPAVTAACMTLAAGLTTLDELEAYAASRFSHQGAPLLRSVLALSNECFRSPPEVGLHLCWVIDAGLPAPLPNPPVFDLDGRLLGYPDLLDVEAGVVGEYDGAVHRSRSRHRQDVSREERYRDHGLEYFTVVAGELSDRSRVVRRIHSTRSRARWAQPEQRQWTTTPPPWWHAPPWLPARYRAAQIIIPG